MHGLAGPCQGHSRLSCCIWDAAQKLFDKWEVGAQRIQYASVVGNRGMSLAWNSLVDSGLCILATRSPSEKGFRAYRNWPDGWHEERLANKGVLWAFWGGPQQGMLVLNTHLTTRAAVKRKQLEELSWLFAELRSKFLAVSTVLEVYICGDFNMDSRRDDCFKAWYEELDLHLLTTQKPTCGGGGAALDHVFLWRSDREKIATEVSDPIKPWVGDFCRQARDDLSDHCWQGLFVP
ncbi:unnamed protein product [Symbiodinium sp. KB8]|nr:unnamed protein product [Symbiodinium sp. KB8]